MILCHCNLITDAEVEDAIISLLDEDRWQLVVPAKVYHRLGERGRCCGCFPQVVDIIVRTCADYHARADSAEAEVIDFMRRLRELHGRQGGVDEGRSQGHRAA